MGPRFTFYLRVGIALFSPLLLVLVSSGARRQTLAPCTESGGKTFCHIAEPAVNTRLSEFPQIRFKDGDLITVRAGGCVQTGGRGRTWKRYVDPSGPNSHQFYHGLIWVPGANVGLERIQSVNNKQIFVRTCGRIKPEDVFLRLGYEDDNYGDNSYRDHDDGTEDQCKDSVNAFVDLEIEHDAMPPAGDPAAPLDLEHPTSCENYDPNLLPLNPRWGSQRTQPPELPNPVQKCTLTDMLFDDPGCSTQHPSFDKPTGTNSVVCALKPGRPGTGIPGHVNYFPAVYTGGIEWDTHTGGLFGDDDYNLNIFPPRKAGQTVFNERSLGIEFDSDETIDNFDTPWWNRFHDAVDTSDVFASELVNSEHAIIAGLVGLDCQHDCISEIHPVFAFAVLVKRTTVSTQPLSVEDTWAIFVRDTGDEGFCSSEIHYLDLVNRTFKFSLPKPTNASNYSILGSTIFKANNSNCAWSSERPTPAGIEVGFFLPENSMIHGDLHLKWVFTSTPAELPDNPHRPGSTTASNEESRIEEQLAALSKNLTKEQLDFYHANSKTRRIKHNFVVPLVHDLAPLTARLRSASREGQQKRGESLHDSQKEARDRKKFNVATKVLWRTFPHSKVRLGKKVTP